MALTPIHLVRLCSWSPVLGSPRTKGAFKLGQKGEWPGQWRWQEGHLTKSIFPGPQRCCFPRPWGCWNKSPRTRWRPHRHAFLIILEVGSPDPGPSRLGGLYTVAFRSAWEEEMGRASFSSCYNSANPIPRAHLMEPSSSPNAPASKYHPTAGRASTCEF